MLDILQIINLVLVIILALFNVYGALTNPAKKRKEEQKKADAEEQLRKDNQKETYRCILRNIITDFYYKHKLDSEMRQYEYENLSRLYTQYKALGGNSFVDKIWSEIKEWRIVN
jgi:hypothetical protein